MLRIVKIILICYGLSSLSVSANLATDKTWLKLLHMHNNKSEIENAEFFLAPDGAFNPISEYAFTVKALMNTQLPVNDESALCKYPARALFLIENGLDILSPLNNCNAFNQWLGDSEQLSISAVYADGYLGNPASFYGHLLFKLNNGKAKNLLTNSLNFGARVPDNENPLVYILKGLVGGYDAEYSSNHFYRYNINYAEVEMRDLWDYQLNFSKQEALLIAAHAWELLYTEYTYYFTHRNCAYHVAKLLEVVIKEELVSPNDLFVLPISVFESLSTATTKAGKSAIKEIKRSPSRQSRFRYKYHSLTAQQQKNLKKFLNEHPSSVLIIPDQKQQIEVLDVALDYLNFVLTVDPENSVAHQKRQQIQRLRIGLPATQSIWPEVKKPIPHTSHKPTTLRASAGMIEDSKFFSKLMFRPAFYDLLSSGGGILPNSSLSMMETEVRLQEDQELKLSALNLLSIETIQLHASGLPGDMGLSWKLKVGNDRDYLKDISPSNEFFVETGIGKATTYKNIILLAQVDARLQSPNALDERLYVSPKLSLLYTWENSKLHCSISYPVSIETKESNRLKTLCEAKLYGNKNYDWRLTFQSHFKQQAMLQYSHYF